MSAEILHFPTRDPVKNVEAMVSVAVTEKANVLQRFLGENLSRLNVSNEAIQAAAALVRGRGTTDEELTQLLLSGMRTDWDRDPVFYNQLLITLKQRQLVGSLE